MGRQINAQFPLYSRYREQVKFYEKLFSDIKMDADEDIRKLKVIRNQSQFLSYSLPFPDSCREIEET
jgi:hypothetical protein